MWLSEPVEYCENSGQDEPPVEGCGPAPGAPTLSFHASTLQCDPYYTDWNTLGAVYVISEFVVPGATYSVQSIDESCQTGIEDNFSAALTLTTSLWGDVVQDCTPRPESPCLPPDGSVDITTDVVGVLDKFSNVATAPLKARADLEPGDLDLIINITDVTMCVDAFRGEPYPFVPSGVPCTMSRSSLRSGGK
jgi:hypothetical protein